MLALSRKVNEAIVIDGNIEIQVLSIQGDKVRLGIKAPKEIGVHRKEIYMQIKQSNIEASLGVIFEGGNHKSIDIK